MIKKYSAFLFRDIGWKLLALLSAMILYFIVMNIVNPLQKRVVPKAINYINEDTLEKNGFIIVNKDKIPSIVQLNIQAKQLDLNNLYNPSVVNAYVDLSSIDESYNNRLGQLISLPISINIPSVYTLMSKNPESISIIIDRVISEFRPVEVIPVGAVKEGYENMPPAYHDTVEVTAPKSILDTISSIRAEIDIKNADKDIIVNEAKLRVIDSDNNDITKSVSLNVYTMQVRIPVYPIKEVPVVARIGGNPKSGYWVSDIVSSPQTVEIVGPEDVLQGISSIELAPIPLNEATSDISVDYNIWDYLKGTSLTIRNSSVFNVNVTVHIDEEATKHLNLLIQNISIIRDNSVLVPQLPTDPIPVTIRGPANAINGISNYNLKAELDLSGLSTGIHDVPLHLDLPSNVSISDAPIKLRVVISEEYNTATVMPSDSSERNEETASNSSLNAENELGASNDIQSSDPSEGIANSSMPIGPETKMNIPPPPVSNI